MPKTYIGFLLVMVAVAGGVNVADRNYAPYPRPDRGYVTDIAGVLTADQEDRIESGLYDAKKDRNVEIAVVIINSIRDYPGTANDSIESFAAGLFNTYGIGKMPKNNGVLLVVAVRDRNARIELGAYHGRRRDVDADRIMQNIIIPHFKKEDYAGGIMAAAEALTQEFAGGIEGRIKVQARRLIRNWRVSRELKIIAVFFVFCLALSGISLFRHGKRGWGWVFVGSILALLLWLISVIGEWLDCSDSEGRRNRSFFGGGFGSGFSGGGGATGRW